MSWPAQSTDLYPIENLWGTVKKKANALCPHSKSPQVITVDLKSIWREVTPEAIKELIDSIPKRVKDVTKARDGPTKYKVNKNSKIAS